MKKRIVVTKSLRQFNQLVSSICTACLFLLFQDLINVWLGNHFLLNNLTLFAIICNFYLGVILLPIWIYREATGLYQQTKYVMVVTAIINLALSIIMAKFYGIAGVLFASVIARLLTYFWYEPVLLFKKYFNASSIHYFFSIIKNISVTAIIVFINRFLFSNFIVNNWGMLFIKTFSIGIFSSVIALLFYYKTEGIKIILRKIIER